MVALCPECTCHIPLRIEDHPPGVTVFCPECETELEVSSLHPPVLSYIEVTLIATPSEALSTPTA
jgi:lysine biosynthesis protein LysW